jgi:rare lipoprotein A
MFCVAIVVALSGCTPLVDDGRTESSDPRNEVLPAATRIERTGIATYLSDEFHGQLTASGIPYDKNARVAAHPTLPFETQVVVTSLDSGKSITVTVVDRLPEKVESIIDVSSSAAAELDMLEVGEANVRIVVVNADP